MKFTKNFTTLNLVFFLSIFIVSAQNQVTTVSLNPSDNAPVISKHIYGHFAEHLGRCIYDGFYVGENSTIPNTAGVRNDIIDALKELKIPNLRWPGGCFADTYHWKDGIGPKDERPSFVNRWWGGVIEDNGFGTHDFLNLCETLGAEPYLAANVGSGTVQELIDWVYYVNHKEGSPMATLRKENGREEPWNVKFWGVGNEMWGCGGHMRPEYYADEFRKYSTFMTDWGNGDGLFRIASGANESDYHWTETLMKQISHNLIEGVALHSYSVINWGNKGPATNFTEELYFKTMNAALKMEERVVKHSAIMDKYDPDNKIALVVDEWGGWYDVEEGTNPGFLYQQNTMRDAMIAGVTLNIFHNHARRVKMANLAQTVNVLQAVILTKEEKMILTPTYHVMNMFKVHQDATLIPVSFNSPDYTYNGEKLPAVSISASKDDTGNVHISLVNIDAKNMQEVELDISDLNVKDFKGVAISSENLSDHNSFDEPNKIDIKKFEDFNVKKDKITIKLLPFSVVTLEGK
ncbi:alpha-N-arabinofuranosidase [Aegicerativicinus sediminis]|uniref:alpha-N-arabinofuranosidase n=1 Tax=Aegicerativicinus sediminis TaxID=2893202 RepID=UPI001E4A9ACF|nr:alpha-L-arabinofuranosidase C-terminal domain-containing protein [Aegicerativicinus sediminis]